MSADPVSLGVTAGLMGLNLALTASQRIEGPRLDDLNVSLGDYGTKLTLFWGRRRLDGCPIFFAEPLHEVHREAKTKGGKYNEYTYFGTWANVIAGHEISGVTRIWWDKHLVYDATGAGPLTPFPLSYSNVADKGKGTATTAVALSDHLRIYLGTEDQEPDPRMVATVEAAQGEGTCPAYRGTPYVIFEEVPLEKVGNRVPQVAIEAASALGNAFPYETFDTDVGNGELSNTAISHDGSRLIWAFGSAFEIWDLPSRTLISKGDFPFSLANSFAGSTGFQRDGTIRCVTTAGDTVVLSGDGSAVLSEAPVAPDQNQMFTLVDGNGTDHWGTTLALGSFHSDFMFDGTPIPSGVDWTPSFFFTDAWGDIWAHGHGGGSAGTTAYFQRMVHVSGRSTPDLVTVTGLPATGVSYYQQAACHYGDATHDQFIMSRQDKLYLIDVATGAVIDSVVARLDAYNFPKQMKARAPGVSSLWIGSVGTMDEMSLADLSIIRTVHTGDWLAEAADGILHCPALNALICWPSGLSNTTIRYLDRIAGEAVTLGDIASDIAERVGITDHDFAGLTQPVEGYSVVLGAGRDMLEPLFTIHDVDLAPHDFGVRGVTRGGTAGATIASGDFAIDGDAPLYTITLRQAADIPRALVSSFADLDKDQQTNTVRAARPVVTMDGKGEQTLDETTLALHADDAADLNDRALRRLWGGRRTFDLNLTAHELRLEPGDLRLLDLDGEQVTARCVRTTLRAADDIVTQWEYDHPWLHSLAGLEGPGFDGRREETIFVAGPARAAILDIPLTLDADETRVPFLYFGAGSYGASFVGADIWSSDTLALDDFVAGWGSVPSGNRMTWGTATDALPDALPWLFDRGSTLNVRFRNGSPTGATEDQLLADGALNLIAVGNVTDGWELLQFAAAELETDGSWTLSTFLRGARGSEWAMAGHAAGDMVVLLSTIRARRSMGVGEIGDEDAYRAVAGGRTLDSAFEDRVTFTAAAQKPYAPVHGVLALDAISGDWSVGATRRTRIGGANIDGGDVPLGETGESWALDILDGSDVVRTLTGASLPLSYSAADQTADFGAPQTSLSATLYQVAPDIALRGYPLALAA